MLSVSRATVHALVHRGVLTPIPEPGFRKTFQFELADVLALQATGYRKTNCGRKQTVPV